MDAFRRGGGADKPVVEQHVLSWARNQEDARRAAFEQWRFCGLSSDQIWDLRTPRDIDVAAREVTADDVARKIPVSSSLTEHTERLRAYASSASTKFMCSTSAKNQSEFIDTFGSQVLQRLRL